MIDWLSVRFSIASTKDDLLGFFIDFLVLNIYSCVFFAGFDMTLIIKLLKKFPASDLYRFVVNGQFHAIEKGWLGYELREPGCLAGAFEALKYAIGYELTNQQISIDLIKNIHKQVTLPISLPGYRANPMGPGEFRDDITNFQLISESFPFGYCTSEGLKDLIGFVDRYKSMGAALIIMKRTVHDIEKERAMGSYSSQAELDTAYAQIRDHVRDAIDSSESVSFDELNLDGPWHYRAPAPEWIESLIGNVCEDYNSAIIRAQNSEDRLRVIVSHVQEIERIHPFRDGNGRTSYILLQRMLIQNGFLPTIMFNPNHIDGFNLDEVVQEVKKGIELTQRLIDDSTTPVFEYKTPTEKFTLTDVIPADRAWYLPGEITDPITHTIKQFYEAEKDLSDFLQIFTIEEELITPPKPLIQFEAALQGGAQSSKKDGGPLSEESSSKSQPIKDEFCSLFLTKFKHHTNSNGIKKMIRLMETNSKDVTLLTLARDMRNIAAPLKDRALSKIGFFSCFRQAGKWGAGRAHLVQELYDLLANGPGFTEDNTVDRFTQMVTIIRKS